MWQAVRENPRAVVYAVLMHVGLLILLVFSLDWTPKIIKPGNHKPVQAELVDSSKLKQVENRKKAEQQQAVEEQRRREQAAKEQAAKEKAAKEKAAKEKAVKEKAAKEKAAREKAVKEKAAKEQAAKEKAAREKAVKEKAAKEKAARDKAARDKAAKEKAARDKAAKEKAAKEQAAKEKAAREKAAAAARQHEAEQALQARLAEEQAQARAQSELSKYIPYIQEKIQRNWNRPTGSPKGMSCLILVKLIPGGEVVDARVVRSSGDSLFDRSVETAVLKASPLPLPEDAALFKYFREINFNFNPDN